ncbi:WASH complex subunit 2 isoform X2 [Ceratina calcarata]|uniref:WASH complex subunit 2 isoform X2 n=1 Tax=Ceratina calcarata TaxID=156304 RepID=A0AAJ7JCC2_9HYME|nr:WASH complex subunit 2 isoform X2 [Ceratina calcarata]
MDITDGMDKSWDHPWTTEEMREKRREWSLAGDAGLLKHLQQFSENLVSRANKTQEVVDSLTTQLNEAAIFVDNLTNTSLALANTQFIESRVQKDDIDIGKREETSIEESKDQDLVTADLIASVSESVKQGLNIMYEKYEEREFVDSDSDEEDNKVVLSVVLGPNNPYQDRPLPDVIGSEKWMNSSKIGLESSSSSESEQVDEEEESETEDDGTAPFKDFSMNAAQKTNIVGSLPSLNEPDYTKRNDMTYMDSEKLDAVSQNNIDSVPESISPNENVAKMPLPNNVQPNFAEELAKRLGTVRQIQKPVVHDKSETSINRSKDELLATEENESGISEISKAVFSGTKEFLNNQHTENSWKEKPIKSYKTNNIIPASIDVPPPINTVSTKPKSAIDDLFGDADSEDSDDIFSPKNVIKPIAKTKQPNNNNPVAQAGDVKKNHLDIIAPGATNNMVTSTPETNTNNTNAFSDDEDSDLFGSSKNQQSTKKKPVGGIPVLRNILTSDVQSKTTNRVSLAQSPESSGNNMPENEKSNANNVPTLDQSRYNILNDNTQGSSIIYPADVNESSYSSGISIHPPSVNNTGGSSINDFQPQMTSTRLKSEELYRERVVSDSLFVARTRNPANATSNSTNVQSQNESVENISVQDDVFENEDLFGPPPLSKTDSKSAKSKVSSLFDDSDSGDELFSTTSSGSRSQKSSDFLTATDKIKSTEGKGLFEEEIDIFDNKDSPDVDIFGITPKPVAKEDTNTANKKPSDILDDDLFASNIRDTIMKSSDAVREQNVITTKKISLFDNDDVEDGDLFATKPIKTNNDFRIFNDDDDNDLFSVKKPKPTDKRQESDKQLSKMFVGGTDIVDQKLSIEKNENSSGILSGNGLFSETIGSHESIFEDDDYDDLFSTKDVSKKQIKTDEPKLASSEDRIAKEDIVKDTKLQDNSNVFIKSEDASASSTTSENIKQVNDKDIFGDNPEKRNVENSESEMRNNPPNSLDINVTATQPSPEENQGAKRSVSGKIKNLMGKMGDLKIISPMDTPPLWRRSEEKTDEEDSTADRDSDDGGCISTQGHSSPPSASDSIAQKQSQISTISGESNAESAISFDEPAQVETLSTASKTRVRIQAKRRPQSRHARKSAIRQSGIDFDAVDTSENNSQDESQFNQSSSAYSKEATAAASINGVHTAATISDRLVPSTTDNIHRNNDANIFLAVDDRSELGSISKESSMSANKNTLLSPSTDEEDLFDVPPDLPEDPQKEDTLFGRAPILSPVEKVISEKPPVASETLKDTHIKPGVVDNVEQETVNTAEKIEESSTLSESRNSSDVHDPMLRESNEEPKSENTNLEDESTEMIDPLRDHSHDPLKDPSQLFAFVTKTPSPDKGKNLLFSEDDSLFTSGTKKLVEQAAKKPALDLFTDDAEGDLFSTTLAVKKPLKDTKINLFDEEDEDDSLFGPALKRSAPKSESEKKYAAQQPVKKTNLFDDVDNDTNIFSEQAQKSDAESVQVQSNKSDMFTSITEPVRTSHITDIFADQSSGDDDIFAKKPAPRKITVTSKSLFPSDEDDEDDHIFGNKSTNELQIKSLEARNSAIKKIVTRDLKKTAKKIGQDPLSLLLDD